VRLDGQQVAIYQQQTESVRIDSHNNLFIDGVKVALSEEQQQALDSYRANLNEYLPRARELARNGIELMTSLLDDIAVSLHNSEAFNEVKRALEELLRGFEQRYQKGDEFVLQQAAFSDAYANLQQDFTLVQDTFNAEFFSSAFTALSESMQQEGGLNLTALKERMVELKSKLSGQLSEQSATMQQRAEQYCDDLEQVAEQEQMLHEKIPQLKDYKVLLI
jgi:predicted  nucleic acid-binding Zn-ribbon protein